MKDQAQAIWRSLWALAVGVVLAAGASPVYAAGALFQGTLQRESVATKVIPMVGGPTKAAELQGGTGPAGFTLPSGIWSDSYSFTGSFPPAYPYFKGTVFRAAYLGNFTKSYFVPSASFTLMKNQTLYPNAYPTTPVAVIPMEEITTIFDTEDLRVAEAVRVDSPETIRNEFPNTALATHTTYSARDAISNVLNAQDDRLLVVVGPCSIHDPAAAREYANRLLEQKERLDEDLIVVMRVYFEKPRTTVGWKGLINDPDLDNSFRIDKGLRAARELLLDLNDQGMPAGTEFLDVFTPQYFSDLVSWGAIGARTTESQLHRELASGLSCPIGFKNGTSGSVQVAVDAVGAARHSHRFLGHSKSARAAMIRTRGNPDTHIILRGGGGATNFDAASVESASAAMKKGGLEPYLMIDFSHANSEKVPANQMNVSTQVATQVAGGDRRIMGVMIESHLVAGRQDQKDGEALVYGQSITDGCIGWDDTVTMLDELAAAVRKRRAA